MGTEAVGPSVGHGLSQKILVHLVEQLSNPSPSLKAVLDGSPDAGAEIGPA